MTQFLLSFFLCTLACIYVRWLLCLFIAQLGLVHVSIVCLFVCLIYGVAYLYVIYVVAELLLLFCFNCQGHHYDRASNIFWMASFGLVP